MATGDGASTLSLYIGDLPFSLHAVQAVVAASQAGSFRQTAERLGVKQSAISRQVRALEDSLGVPLFVRRPTGVKPTWAGVQFLNEADTALEHLRKAAMEARQAGKGQSGRLRIGFGASYMGDRLTRLLACFQADHPSVRFELEEGRPLEQVEATARHELDLAVLPSGVAGSGLDYVELWRDQLRVALPQAHPLAALDSLTMDLLGNHVLFASERDVGSDTLTDIALEEGPAGRLRVARGSVQVALTLVEVGQGLAICSAACLSSCEKPSGLMSRPLVGAGAAMTTGYAVAWSSSNGNPVLRRFVSAARLVIAAKQGVQLRKSR